MGYRRGFSRPGGGKDAEGAGGAWGGSKGGAEREGSDGGAEDCPAQPASGTPSPKSRRRRPWLRGIFALFVIVEAVVLYVVNEYSPVYNFEITSVTVTGEDGVTTVSLLLLPASVVVAAAIFG